MKLSDFDYTLPKNLIAQTPIPDRAASRLLILDKCTGDIRHESFRAITSVVKPGDCLVINDTKVIPARLFGENGGKKVEVLLLRQLDKDLWETLVRPGKKARPSDTIVFAQGLLSASVMKVSDAGNRILKFDYDGIFSEILDNLGQMPLPPYITQKLEDKSRYQTVYAKHEGSAAAPTAGLHFTHDILDELNNNGVYIARITLHVGLGTFRPVKTDNILEHKMHSEYYSIGQSEADKINKSKRYGGRIIAIGTTVCRTLESCTDDSGFINSGNGWTDIFIYPGYKFKITESLITNFHLPKSTLIMLVAAMAGKENILKSYAEAVDNNYRFFSFGDAMLIL